MADFITALLHYCNFALVQLLNVIYNQGSMEDASIGLRERKRQETRRGLEAATIELVIRDGLERTTIEAISERANVSPRTFFNYFVSKEDALLGIREITITSEVIKEHLCTHHNDDTITRIVSLIVRL
ncbi:MAG: helix-turn-helix domain-containing protein, partial [Candidatus Saccharimonadales bacterium]